MNIHIRNLLFLLLLILSIIGFVIGDNTRTIVIYGIGSFIMIIIVLDAFYYTYFVKEDLGVKWPN